MPENRHKPNRDQTKEIHSSTSLLVNIHVNMAQLDYTHYHSHEKSSLQRCKNMESELINLEREVNEAEETERWCRVSGDLAFKELERTRIDLPEIEMERDLVSGECNHLNNETEELEVSLRKALVDRDKIRSQIDFMNSELLRLEAEERDLIAEKQLEELLSTQSTLMINNLSINNSNVEAENHSNIMEMSRWKTETESIECNIKNFTRERNKLEEDAVQKKLETLTAKSEVQKLALANDELNNELDELRGGSPSIMTMFKGTSLSTGSIGIPKIPTSVRRRFSSGSYNHTKSSMSSRKRRTQSVVFSRR